MRSESRTRVLPTMFGTSLVLLACAALLIVGLAGRPANGLAVPTGSRVVHVSEFDYGFKIDGTIGAGNVVLVDTNRGTRPHELVMFKTDAGKALPLRKNKELDEESPSIEAVIDSGSSLAPGETRILTGTLDPGHYVIVCNLPGHFQFGMHRDVTVK
jgi:uncharacterized cupredoxin-like copper-binding protein